MVLLLWFCENVSEADCTTLDSTWSKVVTEPELPVVHGTTLTLNCPGGYTNPGGNTATCLYGQVVVSTNESPVCKGKTSKIKDLKSSPPFVPHPFSLSIPFTVSAPSL